MGFAAESTSFNQAARAGKAILETVPIDELLPRIAAASGHHTHLIPSECFEVARKTGRVCDAWALCALFKDIEGATQASLATWIAWATTAPPKMVRNVLAHLVSIKWSEVAQLTKYLKQVTVRAKQLQHSGRESFTPMFELEVLVNRGIGSVDWDGEQVNRTQLRAIEIPENIVFDEAVQILREGRRDGFKYRTNHWSEWWDTRWLHVPNGSAHPLSHVLETTHHELRKEDGYGKKALLCAVGDVGFERLLALKPEVHAWPSIKYEWGKQRAIYGCDVESFMLSDFALPYCEQALPVYMLTGTSAAEDNVRKVMKLISTDMMPFCFDYEDFNSQHTSTSMAAVVRAWRHVYDQAMSDEQRRACLWTEQSIMTQIVHENKVLKASGYVTKGTLFSGWRLTTFMNSVLNRIYLKWAGSLEHAVTSVHSGDDVYASVRCLNDAEQFLRKARAHGIRAQPSKAATGSIAEFLRIDHRGETTGSQYLPRACATLVHSRIETRAALNFRAMLTAQITRIDEMLNRQASVEACELYREILYSRSEVIFACNAGIAKLMTELHACEGGMSDIAELCGTRLIDERVEEDDVTSPLLEAYAPGINAFARWICRKVGRNDIMTYAIRSLEDITKRATTLVRRKMLTEEYLVTVDDERRRVLKGAWSRELSVGMGAMLRGFDSRFTAMAAGLLHPALAMTIHTSSDPVGLIKTMF